MNEQRLKDLYQSASTHRETASGDCAVPPETMIDVLEGNVSGAERERVMLAIMSNPACRREFELLRALVEQAPDAARTSPRRARPVWPVRVAASFAVLITGALLWRVLPVRDVDIPRAGAAASVQLVAPAPNATADAGARFTWRAVPRALRYEYNLVGDGGRVIFSTIQPDTSLLLPDTVSAAPGERLRWWVESVTSEGVRVRSALRDARMNTP